MFCFQCQETAKGAGCTISGVCGKRPETSRWQDLLLSVVRGIGTIGDSLNKSNVAFDKVKTGDYLVDALFATITNANFDDTAILAKVDAIRKFVVMSGCDGRMKSRDYYREFAEGLPKDVVILTSGCAKYKYNKLQLGDINGIPRVLDAGQCNDSYSWAVVALKLKEIFGAEDINDLPIEFNIAWYEQKAVIVLLALLSLGIKNIHIGPTLPAFVSEGVLKVLVDNFGLGTISTVDEDLKTMIA